MKPQLFIPILSLSLCFLQTTLADGVTPEEAQELRDEVPFLSITFHFYSLLIEIFATCFASHRFLMTSFIQTTSSTSAFTTLAYRLMMQNTTSGPKYIPN